MAWAALKLQRHSWREAGAEAGGPTAQSLAANASSSSSSSGTAPAEPIPSGERGPLADLKLCAQGHKWVFRKIHAAHHFPCRVESMRLRVINLPPVAGVGGGADGPVEPATVSAASSCSGGTTPAALPSSSSTGLLHPSRFFLHAPRPNSGLFTAQGELLPDPQVADAAADASAAGPKARR